MQRSHPGDQSNICNQTNEGTQWSWCPWLYHLVYADCRICSSITVVFAPVSTDPNTLMIGAFCIWSICSFYSISSSVELVFVAVLWVSIDPDTLMIGALCHRRRARNHSSGKMQLLRITRCNQFGIITSSLFGSVGGGQIWRNWWL